MYSIYSCYLHMSKCLGHLKSDTAKLLIKLTQPRLVQYLCKAFAASHKRYFVLTALKS
jgi:hypothetical protein